MIEFFLVRKPVLVIHLGTLLGSKSRAVNDEVRSGFCLRESSPTILSDLDFYTLLQEKMTKGCVPSTYNEQILHYNLYLFISELCNAM